MVSKHAVPRGSLLDAYRARNAYTDCYATAVPYETSLDEFVTAFYVTPLFKLERAVLSGFLSRPSTDTEAHQVATGESDRFAAWTVEARRSNELLLVDMQGLTRSWFMVQASEAAGESTRLLFGSAVVLSSTSEDNRPTFGLAFRLLLVFHKLYSRALLRSARTGLGRAASRRVGQGKT